MTLTGSKKGASSKRILWASYDVHDIKRISLWTEEPRQVILDDEKNHFYAALNTKEGRIASIDSKYFPIKLRKGQLIKVKFGGISVKRV